MIENSFTGLWRGPRLDVRRQHAPKEPRPATRELPSLRLKAECENVLVLIRLLLNLANLLRYLLQAVLVLVVLVLKLCAQSVTVSPHDSPRG